MPIARTATIDLYYEQFGKGSDLLFISGTGGDLRVRPGVLDTPLARHFRVTAYDQRGLGQSAKPAGPYAMADYANDAIALLDRLGLSKVRVIGVSFGGMVAQELAIRAGARVSSAWCFAARVPVAQGAHRIRCINSPNCRKRSAAVCRWRSGMCVARQPGKPPIQHKSNAFWRRGTLPLRWVRGIPIEAGALSCNWRHEPSTILSIACNSSACRRCSALVATTALRRWPTCKRWLSAFLERTFASTTADTCF